MSTVAHSSWGDFRQAFSKEKVYKRRAFVRQGLIFLLKEELFETAFLFLKEAPWFGLEMTLDEFFYYLVREIVVEIDSRKQQKELREKTLKFLDYIKTNDPSLYAGIFRQCCLRHLSDNAQRDFSDFFAWKGFTNDSPTSLLGIGHEWLRELLFFYVQVGDHSSATDEVFNDEFLNRLCIRAVGEFKNLEQEYYSVTVVRDKIGTNTLEAFCFFAEVIGFGISAGSHTEGYGLFTPGKTMNYHQRAIETRNKAYHENYVAAIQRFSEWALFLYAINPEQFLEAIKAYKFHHELIPFLKYYYEGGGKTVLEERYWYKGIKALRSTAQ